VRRQEVLGVGVRPAASAFSKVDRVVFLFPVPLVLRTMKHGCFMSFLGLVHFPIPTQNISFYTHRIKSFDVCMEH
jgi:hypothetical protein